MSAAQKALPPDPENMNNDRSNWANTAIVAFQMVTGTDDEDAVADLLCDLMHMLDRYGTTFGTFDRALERARSNYAEETQAA